MDEEALIEAVLSVRAAGIADGVAEVHAALVKEGFEVTLPQCKKACSKARKRMNSSIPLAPPSEPPAVPPCGPTVPTLGRACWGCGRLPLAGDAPFKRCEKCVDLKLVAAAFCSKHCFEENWDRHKAWHKLQKRQAKRLADSVDEAWRDEGFLRDLESLQLTSDSGADALAEKIGTNMPVTLQEVRGLMARRPDDTRGQQLMQNLESSVKTDAALRAKIASIHVEAVSLHKRGAYSKAAKRLTRGIAEVEGHHFVHHLHAILATIYRDSGDVPRAAEQYLVIERLTRPEAADLDTVMASSRPKQAESGDPQALAKGDVQVLLREMEGGSDAAKQAQARDEAVSWARAVIRAYGALSTPPCADVQKPTWLEGDEFKATSGMVLSILSARRPDEIDFKTDLFDAYCMRGSGLMWSPQPAEQKELATCCKHARVLASDPRQKGLAATLDSMAETALNSLRTGRHAPLPDLKAQLKASLPEDMVRDLSLLEQSAQRAMAPAGHGTLWGKGNQQDV